MKLNSPSPFAPTPYANIKTMVEAFHTLMNDISVALSTGNPGGLQLDVTNEPIGFYITPSEVTKVIGFQNLAGFSKYIVLFGIDGQNLTASIMGADNQGKVLASHKTAVITDPAAPQETWPVKTVITLSDSIGAVKTFMQ